MFAPALAPPALAPPGRPLSSAEETGPAAKKPRSRKDEDKDNKDKAAKPRVRPALHLANFFASAQAKPNGTAGKIEREAPPRRSTRLIGGGTSRPGVKVYATASAR
jgi:anaphase-promoting complex subunit 3